MSQVASIGFAAAAIVSLLLAMAVWVSARGSQASARLRALLLAEALLSATNSYLMVRNEATPGGALLLGVLFGTFWIISGFYLSVLALLQTPLARPLNSRAAPAIVGGLVTIGAVGAIGWAALIATGQLSATTEGAGVLGSASTMWVLGGVLLLVVTSLYGLAAAFAAFWRASPGTTARRRAKMFLIAFAIRDASFLLVFGLGELLLTFFDGFEYTTLIAGSVAYVVALAYGILREHMFDIDLKIKLGISRGTVAGIILVMVFVVAKVVETYLNRTVGFVAGSAVAGVLLFLVPKLNRMGEKVANVAMPKVQPTSDYLAYKKLEVYRAAVESAHETGGISEKDRASLQRLQQKLGLKGEDANAIEAEVVATPA